MIISGGSSLDEAVTLQTSDHNKMSLEEEVKELRITITFFQQRLDQIMLYSMKSFEELKKSNEHLEKVIEELRKVK